MLLFALSLLYGAGLYYLFEEQLITKVFIYLLIAINFLAVIFYGLDKLAAIKGWQRTRERHFYILALMGAWPASLLGQKLFNHKTTKLSFRLRFYLMLVSNLLLFAAYLYYQL